MSGTITQRASARSVESDSRFMNNGTFFAGLALVLASACAAKSSSLGTGSDNSGRPSTKLDAAAETEDAGGDESNTGAAASSLEDAGPRPSQSDDPIGSSSSGGASGAPAGSLAASGDPSVSAPPGADPSGGPSVPATSPPLASADPSSAPTSSGGAPNESACGTFASAEEVEEDRSNWMSDEACAMLDAAFDIPEESKELEVAPLAGVWLDGEGDERVELVLDSSGRGMLVYGEPIDPPAIDDASKAYLADTLNSDLQSARLGFTYEVFPVNGRASEMIGRILLSEPWAEWCSLQTPVRGQMCYRCDEMPGGGFGSCNGQCFWTFGNVNVLTDCGRFNLCMGNYLQDPVCECNGDSCRVSRNKARELTFSLDPVDTTVLRVPDIYSVSTRYLVRVETPPEP